MQFNCCGADPINERCQRSQVTTGAKNLMVWKVRKSTTQSASPKFFEVFLHEHIKTLAADEHACAVRVHSAAPS